MRTLVNGLAVALTLSVVALAADLFRMAGILLYAEQYLAGLLAIAMPLLYLRVPATGGRDGRTGPIPWYDVLFAAVSAATSLYIFFRFPELSELVSGRPWDGLIAAVAMLALFLEGLRRTTGMVLTALTLCFIVLAMFGGQLPGELQAKSIPVGRLTYFLIWDSSAAFGLPMRIITSVVVIFVLFGMALFKSGGSAFFTDFSMALMGRYRGGPAKIAIVGSSLFGTISGSVVSNVLTTGVVTIPMMKKSGYTPTYAAATEAVASTGGQLMPPVMGIAAFIMAEFLQVPYAEVALAALIPAILYYAALFVQVDLEAARKNLAPVEPALLPRLGAVLRSGWQFPIPFAVLIYALFWRGYDAAEAGLLAVLTVLAVAVVFPMGGKRIGLRDLYDMLRDTGLTVIDLFMIGAAAGIIIGAINYSGVGFSLTLSLVHLGGGTQIGLLLLAALVCLVLGMGMPTVGVYILLATLVAPALIELKIDPMAAHMFILYFGCLSMITPPVAIGAFAAANLAGSDPMRTGYAAMTLGWMVYVIPFMFVYSNTLLMAGHPLIIALDCITALVAVWLISAAIMGHSTRPLGALERVVYAAAGILLIVPVGAFAQARWFNIAGAMLAAALFAWERVHRRAAKAEMKTAPATASEPEG
jgi:TRAP transporter 4TM/12TM fusion protein